MKNFLTPKLCLGSCKIAGLILLFAYWVKSGETTGFFLLLFLTVMSLLRWRIPQWRLSVFIDFIACTVLSVVGNIAGVMIAPFFMALILFEAMYLGYYGSVLGVVYVFFVFEPFYAVISILCAVCGFFLSCWEWERKQKQVLRDAEAGRYYELESLQRDLVAALAQIEQMTTVHERARIARDIHDNAGHEIVSAYMTFQTVRNLLPTDSTELLALYDAALDRLDTGTDKIREAVHNLGTVNFFGVESLRVKCLNFTPSKIDFKVYGDTSRIPIYIWSMLESCLSETLTNIARHSTAAWATVELDATPHIVRLCVTNDGVRANEKRPGSGLRNLRHRAAAIGGSLSIDNGEVFSVICVVPIRMNRGERA